MAYMNRYMDEDTVISCDSCANKDICENYGSFDEDDILSMDGLCGNDGDKEIRFEPEKV